jgi:hypothetical protein
MGIIYDMNWNADDYANWLEQSDNERIDANEYMQELADWEDQHIINDVN